MSGGKTLGESVLFDDWLAIDKMREQSIDWRFKTFNNLNDATHALMRREIDELRSRLQALEQNTVPAGSAKQKPHEWTLAAWRLPGSAIWNVGPRGISTPEPTERKTIRVREVLDD